MRARRLTQAVALHDIQDAEAFVCSALHRTGLNLTEDQFDEMVSEGLAILVKMADDYQPRRGDHRQDGRFSGYAAKYLRGKLIDAWHKLNEHHVQTKKDGKRTWDYRDPALSLTALYGNRTDTDNNDSSQGHHPPDAYLDTDKISQMAAPNENRPLLHQTGANPIAGTYTQANSRLIRDLRAALNHHLARELDITVQVAILRGLGEPRNAIEARLGITEIEARAALHRLDQLAPHLTP